MAGGKLSAFRAVFYAASVLVWICVVAAGAELWARLSHPAVPPAPAMVCFSLVQARENFTSVYARYIQPWPAPMPVRPAADAYEMQDDTQREAIAQQRCEWAVLIDADMRVARAYGKPPAGSALWAVAAAPGEKITVLAEHALPQQAAGEMEGRLKGLFQTGFAPSMSMDIPVEGNPSGMRLDVRFVPVRYDAVIRQAIVGFRPSVWMPGGKKHFAPNAEGVDFGDLMMMERFSTNSLGYRGLEIAMPKPDGLLRIVCVGGSTTVEGYDDRLTYPAMLQQMLREEFPRAADRIEVVNCGVFGMLSTEELEMQPEVLALSPDLVIYYNAINDLRFGYSQWLETDGAWPAASDRFRRWLSGSAFMRRFRNDWTSPGDAALRSRVQTTVMDNLEKLFAGYREHGVALAACSFLGPEPGVLDGQELAYADSQFVPPWFEDLNLREYTRFRGLLNEGFLRLCRDQNALYIPTAEKIHGGFDLFTDLCHLTPKGIERKARVVCDHISPWVRERLGLP